MPRTARPPRSAPNARQDRAGTARKPAVHVPPSVVYPSSDVGFPASPAPTNVTSPSANTSSSSHRSRPVRNASSAVAVPAVSTQPNQPAPASQQPATEASTEYRQGLVALRRSMARTHRLAGSANALVAFPHVNYAWQSLADVPYARAPPGNVLRVATPGNADFVDTLPSDTLLVTAALRIQRPALTHCAHYYFNRQCDLGETCRFVHAVFIDPTATTLRRAPAPLQLGRPYHQPSREAPRTRRAPRFPGRNHDAHEHAASEKHLSS